MRQFNGLALWKYFLLAVLNTAIFLNTFHDEQQKLSFGHFDQRSKPDSELLLSSKNVIPAFRFSVSARRSFSNKGVFASCLLCQKKLKFYRFSLYEAINLAWTRLSQYSTEIFPQQPLKLWISLERACLIRFYHQLVMKYLVIRLQLLKSLLYH